MNFNVMLEIHRLWSERNLPDSPAANQVSQFLEFSGSLV